MSQRFGSEGTFRPKRTASSCALSHQHHVARAVELNWSELRNGDLLCAAEEGGFDVLVTADRNLSYQQNLRDRKLAIVVLPSRQWPEVEPQLLAVVAAIDSSKPGGFVDLIAFRREKRTSTRGAEEQ